MPCACVHCARLACASLPKYLDHNHDHNSHLAPPPISRPLAAHQPSMLSNAIYALRLAQVNLALLRRERRLRHS